MAATNTGRFEIWEWSSSADPFTREQMTQSHQVIKSRAAGYVTDETETSTVSDDLDGYFYYTSSGTGVGVLKYSNGKAWFDINAPGSAVSLDGTLSDGVATTFAKSDHRHSLDADIVTETQILNGAVTELKIAANAVTNSRVQDGAVSNAKLGTDISASKLVTGTLNMGRIAIGAITNEKLAASGFDISKFTTGALDVSRIVQYSLGYDKLASFGATSVLGRSSTSAGAASTISAGSNGVLRRDGTGILEFGLIKTANIDNSAVTDAKINSVDSSKVTGLADLLGAKLNLSGGTVTGDSTFSGYLTVGGTSKYLRIRDTVNNTHLVTFATENLSSNRTITFPNQSGTVITSANNSSLNSDNRNSRGVTRLYRRDNNSDYSVQTYWTGTHWRLYGYVGDSNHADTHVGYADSAGYATSAGSTPSATYAASAGNADTTDGLHVHGGRNNEVNKIVRTDVNGYIQAGWINTPSGNETRTATRFYASADDYVRYLTPSQVRSQVVDGNTIYPTTVDADYVLVQKNTTSSAYQNQALQLFTNSTNANAVIGMTYHIGNFCAPVIRAWRGQGTGLDVGNSVGDGYEYIGASSFPVRSSKRFKKNIKNQLDEEIIPNALALLSCRTVKFDDNYTSGYYDEDSQSWKEYVMCDEDGCDCAHCKAIKNDPLQQAHFDRRGMIAEELAEVCPQAVQFDADGIPSGIDYGVVAAELLDITKLLVLQNEEHARKIAELSAR